MSELHLTYKNGEESFATSYTGSPASLANALRKATESICSMIGENVPVNETKTTLPLYQFDNKLEKVDNPITKNIILTKAKKAAAKKPKKAKSTNNVKAINVEGWRGKVDIHHICKMLNISQGKLYGLMAGGEFPKAAGKIGTANYWFEDSVENYLHNQKPVSYDVAPPAGEVVTLKKPVVRPTPIDIPEELEEFEDDNEELIAAGLTQADVDESNDFAAKLAAEMRGDF